MKKKSEAGTSVFRPIKAASDVYVCAWVSDVSVHPYTQRIRNGNQHTVRKLYSAVISEQYVMHSNKEMLLFSWHI